MPQLVGDVMHAWAIIAVLALLWVVMGAVCDWSEDVMLSLPQAVGYRCAVVWRMVKRICGMKP